MSQVGSVCVCVCVCVCGSMCTREGMHVCRYVHVFECVFCGWVVERVFCGWVVERVWVHVSVSVCLGVTVCGPMCEEESECVK